MINIKGLDPDRLKIDKDSYKNILLYHIRCVTVKDLGYAIIDSVNSSYLFINK